MADRDRFGGSERDYLPSGPARGIRRSGVGRLGDMPGARAMPKGPWDQDFRWNRGPSTTVPEGFNDPDRFGRMRPTQANNPYAGRINNNPMGGANIGGGWNLYEGAPERGWDYFKRNLRHATPMSYEDMSYMSPSPFPHPGRPWPPIGRPPWGGEGEIDWVGRPGGGEGEFDVADVGDEYRMWNSIRRKYGADVANQMMGVNVAVNRGGIMGLI